MTKNDIFIHLPLSYFPQYNSKIVNYHINVEILVSSNNLDIKPYKSIEEIGRFLKEHNLSCTIHGPFCDLNPGSADRKIRKVSQERFQQLLALVSPLSPRVVVFHAAFNPFLYGDDVEAWLDRSAETWQAVLETAGETKIALENVLEKTPETILELLLKIKSPLVGACFDVGHFNLFSKASLSDWVRRLGSRIFELHLHDNHGRWDEHLAIGEGEIDIQGLLKMIQEKKLSPALTIEAQNVHHALLSFQRLSSYIS